MSADESLIGLVEVSKQEAQILLEAGYLYMEMGDFQAAQEIFEGCVSLLPRSDAPSVGLGNLLVTQGKHQEAIKAYQNAIKISPESATAHAFLGEVLMLQGQTQQGQQSLQKAIELSPEGAPPAELAQSLLKAAQEGVF